MSRWQSAEVQISSKQGSANSQKDKIVKYTNKPKSNQTKKAIKSKSNKAK